jgi:hypothetical protein
MSKTGDYRATLRGIDDWEDFLIRASGLPGTRANLELVQAAADEGSLDQFRRWLARDEEFLAVCGAVGLGRLIAEGSNLPRPMAAVPRRQPAYVVPTDIANFPAPGAEANQQGHAGRDT